MAWNFREGWVKDEYPWWKKEEGTNEENKVGSETQSERRRKEEKYREEGQRVEEEGVREIGEKGLLKGSPRLKRSFHRLIVR